jgi:hypothetical protein
MAKDRNNAGNQQLALTIASTAWRTSSGIAELILRFTVQVPKNVQSETPGMITGTAHGEPFEGNVAKEGATVIIVPIRVLSDKPRVEATVEVGGQTATTSKDVPFEAPKDGVAVDLITQLYPTEKDGAKVFMLVVGVQLTRGGKGIPAIVVSAKVGTLAEQLLTTNSVGRAEGYFGPVLENQSYDVVIASAIFGERKKPVFIPMQRPPMRFKFVDAPARGNKRFTVTCSIWKTDTGEAVNGHKVTVRVGSQPPKTGTTIDGSTTVGPFNFTPDSRITNYDVFVEGFPPEKGSIQKPRPAATSAPTPEQVPRTIAEGFAAERSKRGQS